MLAGGYLFTRARARARPDLPRAVCTPGLLGGGSQTTVWLYMIWHGGFPLRSSAMVAEGRDDGRYAAPTGAIDRARRRRRVPLAVGRLVATAQHAPGAAERGRYTAP